MRGDGRLGGFVGDVLISTTGKVSRRLERVKGFIGYPLLFEILVTITQTIQRLFLSI